MISTNSDGTNDPALDDGTPDPIGEPYYARLVNNTGSTSTRGTPTAPGPCGSAT